MVEKCKFRKVRTKERVENRSVQVPSGVGFLSGVEQAGRDGRGMGNERVNEAMKWDLVDEIACGVPRHGDSHVDDVGESDGGGTWRR